MHCLSHIDKRKDVIDIGANIGFYTVLLAKQISTNRLVAVEPTSKALNRLYYNIHLNKVESNVTVFEGVISDHNGEIIIKSIKGKEEYSTICLPSHPGIGDQEILEEKVKCITLDDLVLLFNLNPGFIKIDVEGAEMLVFKGGLETLKKYKPIILSELSDDLLKKNGTSGIEIINLIRSIGYKVIDPLNSSNTFENQKFGEILCLPI
jgi:FkbM family methyltransferase